MYACEAAFGFWQKLRGIRLLEAVEMRPHKPDDRRYQGKLNDQVKTMKRLFKARVGVPLFAELHAGIGQAKAPRPRSNKGVDVKAELRHARDAGGKRDEGADYRQEAPQKNGDGAVLLKEARHAIEVVVTHQDPSAIALDERTASGSADPISEDGAYVAADGAGCGCPEEAEAAGVNQVAGEGHDDF